MYAKCICNESLSFIGWKEHSKARGKKVVQQQQRQLDKQELFYVRFKPKAVKLIAMQSGRKNRDLISSYIELKGINP